MRWTSCVSRRSRSPTCWQGSSELAITIDADTQARTITITDNGIGMSREEAIEHLGTIAKSGTAEFLASMTGDQKQDAQLIGQFGVGFYSSFIVADRVEVYSRRAGLDAAEGVHWESQRRRRVQRRDRRAAGARHAHRAASQGGRAGLRRRLSHPLAGAEVFRPHRLPGAHARAEGARTRTRRARVRDRQSRAGAVDPAAHRSEGRGIQGVLSPHHARLHRSARVVARQGRRQEGIHQPAVRAGARAVRSVASRSRARPQALRASRLHHGRRRAVPAAVPALRQRRGRFRRPAAEHLARNAAAGSGHRQHAHRPGAARARHAREAGEGRAGEVRVVLEGVRHRAQGRPGRGSRQSRAHREAAALFEHARRQARSRMCRSRTTSRA